MGPISSITGIKYSHAVYEKVSASDSKLHIICDDRQPRSSKSCTCLMISTTGSGTPSAVLRSNTLQSAFSECSRATLSCCHGGKASCARKPQCSEVPTMSADLTRSESSIVRHVTQGCQSTHDGWQNARQALPVGSGRRDLDPARLPVQFTLRNRKVVPADPIIAASG